MGNMPLFFVFFFFYSYTDNCHFSQGIIYWTFESQTEHDASDSILEAAEMTSTKMAEFPQRQERVQTFQTSLTTTSVI